MNRSRLFHLLRRHWRSPIPHLFLVAIAVGAVSWSCRGGTADRAEQPAAPATSAQVHVLQQAQAEWPGVSVQIVEASRDRGTLTIQWRMANAGARPFEFADRFGANSADRGSVADVTVMDADGRRKYFVLRDRTNRPACSTDLAPLQPGESRLLFARFPAPPAGTSRITIQIPHVPEFREVRVADGGPAS